MSCCGEPKTGRPFDPDDEGPSEQDLCRFGSDVRRCPECRAEMFDSATVCPACGHAIEGSGGSGKKWIVAVALIMAIVLAAWFLVPIL